MLGKLQGYVEQGGHTATTAALTSSTKVQESFPSSTVTVYLTGTTTLDTLYSTAAGAAKANPFTADSDGHWEFYSATAIVDVKFSGGTITTPFTLTGMAVPGVSSSATTGVVNVTEAPYLATGDGVTDDYTAIQTAINDVTTAGGSVEGFDIYIPDGTYLVLQELQIPTNTSALHAAITIRGAASPWTTFTPAATTLKGGTLGMRSVLAVLSTGNCVRNLFINADDKATYGIYLNGSQRSQFDQVQVWKAVIDGWHIGENVAPSLYNLITAELCGNTYATSGIVGQYSNRKSTIAGTATTAIADVTITIAGGPNLTTLGIRRGDFVRVGATLATAFYGKIESVTASTIVLQANFGNLPTANASSQAYAIFVGDGIHVNAADANSNIGTYISPLTRSNGASGMQLHQQTAYGDTVIAPQSDLNNLFGFSLGPADNAGQTYGYCIVRPYAEGNLVAAVWLGSAEGAILSPTIGSSVFEFTGPAGLSASAITRNGRTESFTYGAPQNFIFEMNNNAGTLRHRILSSLIDGGAGSWADKISGATSSWTDTPTVSGVVDFSGGAGILSGGINALLLNTAAQGMIFNGVTIMEENTTGTAYTPVVSIVSSNVNGTTRYRITLRILDAAGGQANWSTAIIPAGKSIVVRFNGYIV